MFLISFFTVCCNRTHIRQLLYLALYPPPEVETDNITAPDANLPTSPSKLGAKQQRSALIPTEGASQAAVRLLAAFSCTNTPAALLHALPSYPLDGSDPSLVSANEDEDSFLARSSRVIREAKHCWELLREGFVKPYSDASVSRAKGRKRKTGTTNAQSEDEDDDGEFEQPSAVAPHAFAVLKWLLGVIERQETLTELIKQRKFASSPPCARPHPQYVVARYSLFLLSQIPAPRTATGKRWDAGTTLEIVIYCMENYDPLKKVLGLRLLTSVRSFVPQCRSIQTHICSSSILLQPIPWILKPSSRQPSTDYRLSPSQP